MESRTRSLVKAFLWQALGLLSMGVVGFLFTGSLAMGGRIALMNAAIGLCVYLIYERIWARVLWGRSELKR